MHVLQYNDRFQLDLRGYWFMLCRELPQWPHSSMCMCGDATTQSCLRDVVTRLSCCGAAAREKVRRSAYSTR